MSGTFQQNVDDSNNYVVSSGTLIADIWQLVIDSVCLEKERTYQRPKLSN